MNKRIEPVLSSNGARVESERTCVCGREEREREEAIHDYDSLAIRLVSQGNRLIYGVQIGLKRLHTLCTIVKRGLPRFRNV